jgi:tellurite resistance protein TehA-like permease
MNPVSNTATRPSSLATLFPGYFALVMATGIVSLAAHFLGMEWTAQALLWINVVAYIVLWALTLARLARYRAEFMDDLTHHARGVTFLTMVAGTCVLGSQFAILTPWLPIAEGLWLLGLALWLLLIYTFFAVVTIRATKPALDAGINGAWMLIIVSTESLCVLGTSVATALGAAQLVLLISLGAYLAGGMLYFVFITLILYRWIFFDLKPEKLVPSYWINMGAVAIATLAGSRLLLTANQWSFLQGLAPFITGLTFFFWATATWWIPLLFIVGIWRHGSGRVPLTYDPQYWSMVFPLGMYTTATFMLAKATAVTLLNAIPVVFIYIALAAWITTFFGMIAHLVRLIAQPGMERLPQTTKT